MYYDGNCDPERYLIERDILAPLFDQEAHPLYSIRAPRLEVELKDFGEALDRYIELVKNWKATETYVHPGIFRWDEKWVEGVQQS